MDTTSWETSSDASFDWSDLTKELKEFQKITQKNIQALAGKTKEVSKLQIFDTNDDTKGRLEEAMKNFISSYRGAMRLSEQHAELVAFREAEKKILKNIDNITTKISSVEEEIGKCTEERKKLRKEYKASEALLQKVIQYFETKFDVKVIVEDELYDSFKAAIYFSPSEPDKYIKILVDSNEMKVKNLEVVNMCQEKLEYLQNCLQDETKLTPTACVIRDALKDQT